ncbi:MAG: MBL fold metallo-hydrolase [Clostridia bacterium]|nr:MBL fold metallo-hydrolase [Clostridia bacterium]
MSKSKFLSCVFCIIALIVGFVAGFSAYAVANSPQSDKLFRVASGDLSVHFLELGNKYAGDCIYVKANETDILIDAGSRQGSITTIKNYIDNYCTDNTLEYVIATHAHQDHIAAFSSTSTRNGIFAEYICENIIDFGTATKYERNGAEKTDTYSKYIAERNNEISSGANHIAVSNYNEPDFQKEFDLGSGITLTILNNHYYYNKTSNENNYSVCVLLSNGANNILLTGDLEDEGEEKLVELNPNLPQCSLFKAAHHGSYTGSHDVLLNKIKPENVVFTCVAGATEYTKDNENTFPSQAAINRIANYTKNAYVTSLCIDYDTGKFQSMNGDIIFIFNKDGARLTCTNNYTLLKDTAWFKANRTTPAAWAN